LGPDERRRIAGAVDGAFANVCGDDRSARDVNRRRVRIRTSTAPYVYAKIIVTPTTAFFESQNLSSVSLQDHRDLGLVVTGSARAHLATWFDQ
jgi:hypothetical protein